MGKNLVVISAKLGAYIWWGAVSTRPPTTCHVLGLEIPASDRVKWVRRSQVPSPKSQVLTESQQNENRSLVHSDLWSITSINLRIFIMQGEAFILDCHISNRGRCQTAAWWYFENTWWYFKNTGWYLKNAWCYFESATWQYFQRMRTRYFGSMAARYSRPIMWGEAKKIISNSNVKDKENTNTKSTQR